MNDPFVTTIVVWVVGSTMTGLALRDDRGRLDAVGRQRMWRETTLWAAVSGLFVPPPLTFGAHVWVTRTWPWWRRLPLAVLSSLVLVIAVDVVCDLVLWVIGRLVGAPG